MKIAIFLGHPAHFHMFKNVAKYLQNKGHKVEFVIKEKDILETLLKKANYDFTVIRKKERRSNSKLGLMLSLLKMDFLMLKYLIKNKPNILIGTYVALLSKISRVPIITVNEDDASVVPFFALTSYPLANAILNPISCNSGRWDNKAIKYSGYQKLAYLHPNQFVPDKNIVEKYFSLNKPYVFLRFAKLNAHHDAGVGGIDRKVALNLISILQPYFDIYISSERKLEEDMIKYQININPLDVHHILAYSSLYIGDSQSMAVEAAMLGVPSIRFNDFAGKIGVLEELEHKYGLTFGIKTDNPDKLYQKVNELLNLDNLSELFRERRQKMLSDKIDVTAFFVWFIENYPKSVSIMKDNPDFELQFK